MSVSVFKPSLLTLAVITAGLVPFGQAQADRYDIDIEGQHAFVQFKISHLGFSYILGSFETFGGDFFYDPDNLKDSDVNLEIQISSLNTNHAERDRHILSEDFLDVARFPTASFETTGFSPDGDKSGVLSGELTMHGETQAIEMPVTLLGEGLDPWGSYRAGFEGSTDLVLADYGIDMSEFPEVMHSLELYVTFEGVKQ